jgi:hypothetical protein
VITYPCGSDCFWIVPVSSSFQSLVVLLRSCPFEVPTTPLYIFPGSEMYAGSALPRVDNHDGKNKNACRRREVSMGHIVSMTLQVDHFPLVGTCMLLMLRDWICRHQCSILRHIQFRSRRRKPPFNRILHRSRFHRASHSRVVKALSMVSSPVSILGRLCHPFHRRCCHFCYHKNGWAVLVRVGTRICAVEGWEAVIHAYQYGSCPRSLLTRQRDTTG